MDSISRYFFQLPFVMLSAKKIKKWIEIWLLFALSEINRMASQLSLPTHVQEITAKIYREAVKQGLIQGRSIEGIVSAALCAACREAQIPRTLEEVAEVTLPDKFFVGINSDGNYKVLCFTFSPPPGKACKS